MPRRSRKSWVIIVLAMIVLIGAAIMWWDVVVNEGFAGKPLFRASLFTLMGIFFLLMGIRPRTNGGADGTESSPR